MAVVTDLEYIMYINKLLLFLLWFDMCFSHTIDCTKDEQLVVVVKFLLEEREEAVNIFQLLKLQ